MKKKFNLIIIPLMIYIIFAAPRLKELATADSTFLLIAADEMSGSRQWINFPFKDRTGLWHPPLHIFILSIIRKLFGTNIIFFRLFYLGCGLISIIFIYLIGSEVYRDKKNHFIPLLACFIYSINPLVINGSLHLDIDNTVLTTLMLVFIFLFLKNMEDLNIKNTIQLSFVFALLLSTKFTTPPLLMLAILFYLLMNKKFNESIRMLIVSISGLILFFLFWMFYSFKFHYPPLFIFDFFGIYNRMSDYVLYTFNRNLYIYDIFRNILCFSPFFILLWLLKTIERLYGIFKYKILYSKENLLVIISVLIYIFYLFVRSMAHGFPKYHFPVISIMSILIADIIIKVRYSIMSSIKIFIIIIGLALIYNLIFVGDLLYLINYRIKEVFIRSNFNVLVLQRELFNMLFRTFLLVGPLLPIFIFYHKKRKLKSIDAVIISSFIMFTSGSLALDIIQYKAPYYVTYTYGKQGTKDVVRFLQKKITPSDRIIAPSEIVYYLEAVNSGFVVSDFDLAVPEKFLRVLQDIKPSFVVYGIASNTIKQYKNVFSSELISGYFQSHHFKSMDIGSYTLWIKNNL